jgi:hypothetical protein
MITYNFTMPNAIAHVFGQQKRKGVLLMKLLYKASMAAVQSAESSAGAKQSSLRRLLKDLAWHRLQITLEIFAILDQFNESLTGPEAVWRELETLAEACYKGPATTKRSLEDMFNQLKDAVTRHRRGGQVMSRSQP